MEYFLVNEALAETDTITVQDTNVAPTAPESMDNASWQSVIPMVLIFVVFYFFLIRPQEKKRKQQEQLISGVKVGEEVLTNSGIFGIVRKVNDSDNFAYIEIAKDVQIKIMKNSITDIINRKKEEGDKQPKQAITDDKKQINKKSNKKN